MEKITVREAARRLGVSDMAVHKAIKAGRVSAERNEKGKPVMAWPQVEQQWRANSDPMKRSHVGSRGSARRQADEATKFGTSGQGGDAGGPPDDVGASTSYAKARAIREAYMARLAKLEFEERNGKLVDAEQARAARFKEIKAAQTRILGIPAACKTRVPDLPLAVVAVIDAVCRETLEDLANGVGD